MDTISRLRGIDNMKQAVLAAIDRIFNLLDTGLMIYAIYRIERILAQSVANFRAIASLIERRASFRPSEDIPPLEGIDPPPRRY